MAWQRSRQSAAGSRAARARHGRHGRQGRSPVVRPPLPPLETRIDRFDMTVGVAADYLRGAWPQLRDAAIEIADMPASTGEERIPRWSVSQHDRRIVLYRLPIERLSRLHRVDDLHRRMVIESCVFRAAAEYLGKDPWDLGPERYRFL